MKPYSEQEAARISPMLVGKNVRGVLVDGTQGRLNALTLYLDDGTRVRVDFWAEHAMDSSLEVNLVEGDRSA